MYRAVSFICHRCYTDHIIDIHQAIFCFVFLSASTPFFPPPTPPASIPFFACEMKFVTPYKRGFFCGDPSITYPNITTEAIPDSLLIAGGIAITGVAVRQ